MKNILITIQIILALALVFLILIQPKGSKSFTRRGLERLMYKMTFVVSALFLINAVLILVV